MKLLNGDCLELLKTIPSESIDLIATDPAYWTLNKWRNVGTTTRLGGHKDEEKQDKSKWFDCIQPQDLPDFIQEIYRVLKPNAHAYIMCDFETLKSLYACAITEGVFPTLNSGSVKMDAGKALILQEVLESEDLVEYIADMLRQFATDILNDEEHFKTTTYEENATVFIEALMEKLDIQKPYQTLVWDKLAQGMGYSYRAQHEYIFMLWKGPKRRKLNSNSIADVIQIKRVPHTQATVPTEKPVELFKILIEQSSNIGEVVLDPFMGSGSSGVAAKETGRDYIGIELSPENYKLASVRLQENKQGFFK